MDRRELHNGPLGRFVVLSPGAGKATTPLSSCPVVAGPLLRKGNAGNVGQRLPFDSSICTGSCFQPAEMPRTKKTKLPSFAAANNVERRSTGSKAAEASMAIRSDICKQFITDGNSPGEGLGPEGARRKHRARPPYPFRSARQRPADGPAPLVAKGRYAGGETSQSRHSALEPSRTQRRIENVPS